MTLWKLTRDAGLRRGGRRDLPRPDRQSAAATPARGSAPSWCAGDHHRSGWRDGKVDGPGPAGGWSSPTATSASRRSRIGADRRSAMRSVSRTRAFYLREDQSDLANWTRGDRKARFEQTAERHAGLSQFAAPFLSRMKCSKRRDGPAAGGLTSKRSGGRLFAVDGRQSPSMAMDGP